MRTQKKKKEDSWKIKKFQNIMLRLLGRKTITDKVSSEGQKSIWALV